MDEDPESQDIAYRKATIRVSGYFWLLDTDPPAGTASLTEQGQPEGDPIYEWPTMITDAKISGLHPLIADATLSNVANLADPSITFTEVIGGLHGRFGMYDSSNHFGSDGLPIGTNIQFMDGHSEWRKFDDMQFQFNGKGATPAHWW